MTRGPNFRTLQRLAKRRPLSAQEILLEAGSSAEPWDHCEIEIWEGSQLVEVVQLGLILTERDKPTEH